MKKILIVACIFFAAITVFAFNISDGTKQQSPDYVVVESADRAFFQAEVKRKLANGWTLAGGIGTRGNIYVQALHK